jgi:hypothetical protein
MQIISLTSIHFRPYLLTLKIYKNKIFKSGCSFLPDKQLINNKFYTSENHNCHLFFTANDRMFET